MDRAVRYALRLAALAAAVVLLQAVLNPGQVSQTPYLSALSDLASGSAVAAVNKCPNRGCSGAKCVVVFGSTCTTDGMTCGQMRCFG